ncbi:MAG: putative tRNA threonylcarbamoyladenosine biosynthesis protein Gcp, partial [Parcubacteria group bacterium GW2011_GWC2_44_22]
MHILAIETSCDETSAAVISGEGNQIKILSNIVGSQIKIHAPYGGVVPELAARRHAELLLPVISEALKKAGVKIDVVAATYGPGLVIALFVG